jgi:hypothetical protein
MLRDVFDRGSRLAVVAFVVVALADACAAAPAGARAPVSAENAAATHAYLAATNSFEEAEVANLPQSIAASEASAAQIASECPGILTNAPPHERVPGFGILSSPSPGRQEGARAEGERARQSRQLSDLKFELATAVDDSRAPSDREASTALLHALTPLRWSNPTITLVVRFTLEVAQEELNEPTPSACADMKAWVASGYRTLSPTSREFASRLEAALKSFFELLAVASNVQSFTKELARYENAADRKLERHIQALTRQLQTERSTQASVVKRLEVSVGLPPAKEVKEVEPEAPKPVAIDHGRTAAGGRFVVKAEPQAHRHNPRACTVDITITEASRPSNGFGELLSGEGTGRCLSRSHVEPEPAVHCKSGLLTIEAALLPAARNVSLLLSDGHTIVSPAIRVPSHLGGPAALYYQVVRGPSPIPVSLTELGASGNTVAVLKLPAVVECTKHPVKYFRDGIVTLVHESAPQIPAFTIRAERYRKLGTVHFELKLDISSEETLFSESAGNSFESNFAASDGEQAPILGGGRLIVPNGSPAFEPSASSGCLPQPYAILYGVLKAPRDTVFARVAGKLVELPRVAIPAHLHAGGVLVYGALSPLPTELLIRGPSGKTITRRDLAEAAKSSTETCEGEAEG